MTAESDAPSKAAAAEEPEKKLRPRVVSGQRQPTAAKMRRVASAPPMRVPSSPALIGQHPPREVEPPSPTRLTPRQLEDSITRLSRPSSAIHLSGVEPKSPISTPRTSSSAVKKLAASSQSLDVRHVAPSYSFGAASRAVANKVFVSQQHTLTIAHGTLSPGPAHYTQKPAIGGKQPDGRKSDPPNWVIGSGPRFLYCGKLDRKPGPGDHRMYQFMGGTLPDGAHANRPKYSFAAATREQAKNVFVSQKHTLSSRAGTQSPGPIYELQSAIGQKQSNGRIRDGPAFHMSGRKSPYETGPQTPGAQYNIQGGLGRQVSAAFRTEPRVVIATKARPPVDAGTDSPGPIYEFPSAFSRQPLARQKSAPVASFSKYSRWADHEREARKNSVPGPGYYG